MHFIAGISNALSKRMYSFLILRSMNVEHFCDGYIVTGLCRNEITTFAEHARKWSRPVALFGHTDLLNIDYIDVDNVQGAYLAVQQLTMMGHRRIAMINVAEDKDYTDDRHEGYVRALEEAGVSEDVSWVVAARNDAAGGKAAAHQLLENTHCTAIFCATDTIAIGACQAIREQGLACPADISVVGFDGLGHHLLCSPGITTVQQPIYEIGELLAETLLDRLDGKTDRIQTIMVPRVIQGGSIAPLR